MNRELLEKRFRELDWKYSGRTYYPLFYVDVAGGVIELTDQGLHGFNRSGASVWKVSNPAMDRLFAELVDKHDADLVSELMVSDFIFGKPLWRSEG